MLRVSSLSAALASCLVFVGCVGDPPPPNATTSAPVARCTHSVGLCNLPLFIAAEDQNASAYKVKIALTPVPDWGKHAIALQRGDVEFSVTPFTNVMTAYGAGVPLRVIAGSGMNGLRLVAAKGIDRPEDLRGKKVGTFRADTLEVMLYSYLEKGGVEYSEVDIVYYDDSFKLSTAFENGLVDAMTHVEPYATRAIGERESTILATGEGPSVWNADHPDCVLVTTAEVLDQKPDKCRFMIEALLEGEATILENPEEAARRTAAEYFRAKVEDIVAAGKTQRPLVDIRGTESFMEGRFRDLVALGHVPRAAKFDGLMALDLLNEVMRSRDASSEQKESVSNE